MKVLLIALALAAQTAETGPALPPEDEARAQDLMREIRCMVCAGESIMDSNAGMALDMRRYVREQVAQGAEDGEVRQSLVERFGHEVLMRPSFDARSAPLWIAPLIFLMLGGALLFATMRKKRGG
ncbi:MAG: cytochrome c-type biogenesis protein CcmH [Oceanicaulis sp.]